nr:uncharacterized protein LOC109755645 isoform X1 [Aegilops tauschii subsp. strangulata]
MEIDGAAAAVGPWISFLWMQNPYRWRLGRGGSSQELYLRRRRPLGFISSPGFHLPRLTASAADAPAPAVGRRRRIMLLLLMRMLLSSTSHRVANPPCTLPSSMLKLWVRLPLRPCHGPTDGVHAVPAAHVVDALDDYGADAGARLCSGSCRPPRNLDVNIEFTFTDEIQNKMPLQENVTQDQDCCS